MRTPGEDCFSKVRCQRCERPIEGIEFTLPGVVLPFDACRPCRVFRYVGNVEDLDRVDTETLEAVMWDRRRALAHTAS